MNVSEYLRDHGIKPSYPRIRILNYMLTRKNHPTVDMIYDELSKEIPTLSRTTVYNTVNLLSKNGLVQRLTIDEQEVRYDADISFHTHFKCEKCGKILDLPVEGNPQNIIIPKDLYVREIQCYLFGLCDKCNRK
jgi:Fe2+ or Zn2+ uptake regulation protein